MIYEDLCTIYDRISGTSKRLGKTYYIAELLAKAPTEDLGQTILLLQGRIFPLWDERNIGVASKIVIKAICSATGSSKEQIERELGRTGDLGLVAEKHLEKKKQATLIAKQLTVKKVFENIQKLATLEGAGSVDRKIQLISELLVIATGREAKYIVRMVLQDLRVGVGEGTIRDAIAWAFFPKINGIFFKCAKCKSVVPTLLACPECQSEEFIELKGPVYQTVNGYTRISEETAVPASDKLARETYNYVVSTIQEAFDLTNDYGKVAEMAKTKGFEGLQSLSLTPGIPINVMLYQKSKDIEEGFEQVGKPAAFEYKYDGFRVQAHKKDSEIKLFTRRLEDVTKQFPELVSFLQNNIHAKDYILDGEAVGYDAKTMKYLPFQHISQRIKRKHDISRLSQDYPVEYNVFDILFYNSENLLKKPFIERRKLLEKIIEPKKGRLVLSNMIITDDPKEAEKFYEEALSKGNEGIMAKKLDGIYKPGKRVGYGIKIKPIMETLDLVIVKAEWGEGKRAKWLTSYTLACSCNSGLAEIGKVSTGLKELREQGLSYEEMTDMLKPLIMEEKGKIVQVKPKIVLEIAFEEIQVSPTYQSGYALRFPRVIRLREDKGLHDINNLETVKDLFERQKGKK